MELKGNDKNSLLTRRSRFFRRSELKKSFDRLVENVIHGQEISKVGSWTHDLQKDEMFFTDEVYKILEATPDEFDVNFDNFLSFIHPEDVNEVKEAIESVIHGKECDFEFRIITKNNVEKYVHEKTKVIYDKNNNPIRIIGIFQDITKHKIIERNLREIGNDFILAQKVAGVGSWKYDCLRDEFCSSEEVYRILGIEPSKEKNSLDDIIKLIHPEDEHKLRDALESCLLGQTSNIEIRILQDNEVKKYVIVRAEPMADDSGSVNHILGTFQDVTKNKLLEQELMKNYKIINQAESLALIGSWEIDFESNKIYYSDMALKIYGIDSGHNEITFEEFKNLVIHEDFKRIEDMLRNPSEGPIELEFRIIRKDGSVRNIYQVVEFVFDKAGKPIHLYGTIQDVTREKELLRELELEQDKLKRAQIRFDTLIRESVDVFEILDETGRLVYISEASEKVTGYRPEERLGKIIYEYYEESEKIKIKDMMEKVLSEPNKSVTGDLTFKSKSGQMKILEIYMQNFLHNPSIEGIIVNIRDVTNRVEAEKRIIYLSTHDQLTGLPNKVQFEKLLNALYKDANVMKMNFALFLLDVMSYEYIKNILGYIVAEQYIVLISKKLQNYFGTSKNIYRYSENQFVVIIEDISSVFEYREIIKEIYDLFAMPIKVDKYEFDVDLNIGISTHKHGDTDAKGLVRHAETALFLAKNDGNNKYKFYSSDLDIQSYKHFVLRNDLRNVVENNQLRIYFHPFVNLRTNEILACEALIRWEHPEWGVVPPKEFVSMAEETGYIIQIGEWLFNEICRIYKQWLIKGMPKIKVAVNFSSIEFFGAEFVDNIIKTINKYELEPDFLIIEITESILIDKKSKVISDINRLRSYGIQIALDDFGAGYSSLAYLNSFNIDIIKIDGSFIKNINVDKTSTIITKNIINMAQELNLKIVAEHIETWEQLSFIKELRCFTGQGYIFGKPLPLKEFEKVLARGICKTVIPNTMEVVEERRRFFRLKFLEALEADLTLVEISGRKVEVGNTKVLVIDIGPGGLRFISNIILPIQKDIILQFTTEIIGEELCLNGYSVWTEEIDNNLFEYGVEFIIDEKKRTDLVRLLNQVQIKMKNNVLFADGRFISVSPRFYFKQQETS